MTYIWEDLPERKNCFTVRSAAMINLNTGEIIRHYSANTKIVVVQKCVTPTCTYYRTSEAAHHYLNYAFKASAFGLPNEGAPSAHSTTLNSSRRNTPPIKSSRTLTSSKKQTLSQRNESSKGGERARHKGWLRKIFRRKNG